MEVHIPDFPIIYDLCKEYELHKKETPTIESLEWKQFNVKNIRLKFKDVDCGPFEKKRQEVMADLEINQQGDAEWNDALKNTAHVYIKRMGALCHAVSFHEIPMMLSGPWLSEMIHVRGRAEGTTMIREEEWKLDKDPNNEDIYVGTYTLKQRPKLSYMQTELYTIIENAP
eukprot:980611_1